MLTFNFFTESDWYGFCGAERFADKTSPLIAGLAVDGCSAVAIYDGAGVCMMWARPTTETGDDELECAADIDSKLAASVLGQLTDDMTSEQLAKLGFTFSAGALLNN